MQRGKFARNWGGDPLFFAFAQQIAKSCFGTCCQPAHVLRGLPHPAEVVPGLVVEHYLMMLEHYGTEVGVRHARKHLGWYLDCAAPQTPVRRVLATSVAVAIRVSPSLALAMMLTSKPDATVSSL